MKIGISMEMTRILRDTWHAALNHEWYDIFAGHEIVPLSCQGQKNFQLGKYLTERLLKLSSWG